MIVCEMQAYSGIRTLTESSLNQTLRQSSHNRQIVTVIAVAFIIGCWNGLWSVATPGSIYYPATIGLLAATALSWALPTLAGPNFTYPCRLTSVIWFLVYGIGAYRWHLEGKANVDLVPLLASGGLLSFYLAYLLAFRFGVRSKRLPKSYFLGAYRTRALLLIVAGMLATVIFVAQVGIPALRSDALTYRFQAAKMVGGYTVFLIRALQIPMYALFALVILKYIPNKTSNLVLFLIFTLLVFFANYLPGWRNPLFIMLVTMVLIYTYSGKLVKSGRVALYFSLIIFATLLAGFLRLYNLSTVQRVESIQYFSRIADGPVEMFFAWSSNALSIYCFGFLQSMSIFPSVVPHLNGGVFLTTLATFLPGDQPLLDMKLKEWSGLEFAGGGLNLSVLGESYADFGYFGCLVYPFIYGFVIGKLVNWNEETRSPASLIIVSFATCSVAVGSLLGLLSLSSFWVLGAFLIFVASGQRATYAGSLLARNQAVRTIARNPTR